MLRSVVNMKKKESRVFPSVCSCSQSNCRYHGKNRQRLLVGFQLLVALFFFLCCANPTSSHYPSSFGLILLARRVDEGQPPASAGGMPETTLSKSDLVMILKPLICCLFGNVELYDSLMMEAASLFEPNTSKMYYEVVCIIKDNQKVSEESAQMSLNIGLRVFIHSILI